MIAQDGVAQRTLYVAQDFRASICELVGSLAREETFRNVVAIKEHEIGIQAINAFHYVANEVRFRIFRVVEIGDLDDAETAKFIRKAIKADVMALDADFMARDLSSIEWNADSRYSRGLEKGSTGDPFSNFSLLDRNVHFSMINTPLKSWML